MDHPTLMFNCTAVRRCRLTPPSGWPRVESTWLSTFQPVESTSLFKVLVFRYTSNLHPPYKAGEALSHDNTTRLRVFTGAGCAMQDPNNAAQCHWRVATQAFEARLCRLTPPSG